ncbi:MAG: hypothetical protein IK115_00200 [Lachnospiraceae bacterium]|nr:hypothetical protein [Lachnospiraceae bacterium]
MDGKKTALRFLKRLAAITLLCMLAVAFVVVLFDPFYHYHGPLPGMQPVLEERDYEVIGTIDHFDYDAILLGDSLVENTNTRWLSELFEAKAVKAIRAGGSNADLLFYLDRAYEAGELKQVFYCIDRAVLCADTTLTFPENDYWYLVNRNPLDDWKYLWNKDVLLKKIPIQLAYNTVLDYDPGEAYDWYRTKTFSTESMKVYYEPQENFDEAQPVPAEFEENLALLKERISAHPETVFYLFYPPTSLLSWDKELREGGLEADLAMIRRLSTAFADCPNVKLFGFFAAEDYAATDHYMDVVHFSPEVNYAIFEDMAEGRCTLNSTSVEDELDKLKGMIRDFSGDKISGIYPEAVTAEAAQLP